MADQLKSIAPGISPSKRIHLDSTKDDTSACNSESDVAYDESQEAVSGSDDNSTSEKSQQQLYEEAMKQGAMNVSIVKCLVLGIAGVGKTSLKRLLLQQDRPVGRISTGLADNPIKAFVGSVSESVLLDVDEKDNGKWEVIDETKLMQLIARTYQLNATPSAPKKEAVHDFMESQSNVDPAIEKVLGQFIDLLENNKLDRKENSFTLIHFIDSGGQPQFHELLPLFVQHFSTIIYAINLSERMDYHPMIYLYGEDCKPVGDPYKSPFSQKEVLHQCVRATYNAVPHPKVAVVGTHRDNENSCSEKKKNKDIIIRELVPPDCRVEKNGVETIWDVNGHEPNSYDHEVATELRQAIVHHSKSNTSPVILPIKWFILELLIAGSAMKGVLSLKRCFEIAQRLYIDETCLKAALHHIVKYNIFLWYDNVPMLKDIVFSDPQVILKIITDLVQCKHNPAEICGPGFKGIWRSKFVDHAIISHDFLSHDHFKKYFVQDNFTVEHFTALMCHLFVMVHLKDDDYLMPALLDPLNDKNVYKDNPWVDPLLVGFPNVLVPRGLFSCLVVFLQKECSLVENKNVPVCLYRNCVSFKHKKFPAQFTIIDSVCYIEVHFESEISNGKPCREIKQLIHSGIKTISSEVLHYSGWKDFKYGFSCSNNLCNHIAVPYANDLSKAACSNCEKDMVLTSQHTVWLMEKDGVSGGSFPTVAQKRQRTNEGDFIPTLALKRQRTNEGVPQAAKTENPLAASLPSGVPQTAQIEDPLAALLPSVPSSQLLSEFIKKAVVELEGTPTLVELLYFSDRGVNIAEQIGVNYLKFGIFLLQDSTGTIVKAIENEHQRNAEQINLAILQKWLEGKGVKPVTWSSLVTALEKMK